MEYWFWLQRYDGEVLPRLRPATCVVLIRSPDSYCGPFIRCLAKANSALTLGSKAWKVNGNTNVWPPMSVDESLGMVYLPTGAPTNNYYGGQRLGDNLFANSLVALDCASGQRQWHFQTVHHDIWDYDLPAAPNLIDIVVDAKPIKAIAQVSKQGFLFVFDRATGEPVWPIEETPVPASDVPGEALYTSQFPAGRHLSCVREVRRRYDRPIQRRGLRHSALFIRLQPPKALSLLLAKAEARTGVALHSIRQPKFFMSQDLDLSPI